MNRTKTITAAALGALSMLLAFTASAPALQVFPFSGSIGPGGPGVGTFSHVNGVAVDQSTGDVYVLDAGEGGRIYKFDAQGEPAAFSGLGGSNVIEGVGSAGPAEQQIAVDSSSGPDRGDIYMASNAFVKVFSSAGLPLDHLTSSSGEVCGVAVGADGHVYVGNYPRTIKQYAPVANPVTNADYVSSLNGLHNVCNVSVDTEGNVYAATYTGGVYRYASSQFNTSGESATSSPPGPVDETGRTLVSGPTGADVLIDEVKSVVEYTDTGAPERLGRFGEGEPGQLSESFGLAVNTTMGNPASGKVYAGDGTAVNIYGPPETIPAPTVEDQPPIVSGITRTTAQIAATVNPNGEQTSLAIEYASDTEYRAGAAEPYALGAISRSVSLEALHGDAPAGPIALKGLTAGTTYHYRLVAQSVAGTTDSADHTFTTAAATPPVVSTGAAGEVSQTAALLTGIVEAQGLQTSYEFEVGTDASYSGAELFGNAGQSAGAESVSTVLQYLVPGVTYHYRLVATNEDGISYGQDMTFTTPGVPAPIVQPPSAPLIASPAVVFPTIPAASKSGGSKKKGKPGVKKKSSRKKRGKAKRKAAMHAPGRAGRTGRGGKRS
jgi:hypothetical protein